MRFAHVFTVLFALASVTTAMLALFAGASRSFLQNTDILTLNVSRIGHGSAYNKSDLNSGLLYNNYNDGSKSVQDLMNNRTSDIAEAFGLADFYKVHVLTFCVGNYEPYSTATDSQERVTRCSGTSAGYFFDLSNTLQDDLQYDITLGDLEWPHQISDLRGSIRSLSIAMFFFLVAGITFSIFSIIAGFWGIFSKRRLSSVMAIVLIITAALCLFLAATCATALSVKVVNWVNRFGTGIGISADVGVGFLGVMWGAAAFCIGALIFASAQACAGRYYDGFTKVSSRHMKVPRSWRHPAMNHPGMQGSPMHPAMMHPGMHPMMHPAMHHPGMHPMMHPGMQPMMHPAMGGMGMGSPYY